MRRIVIFFWDGKRDERTEREVLKYFGSEIGFKETLDKLGYVITNPSSQTEMCFIRQDERYMDNLKKYLEWIASEDRKEAFKKVIALTLPKN